MVNNNRRGKVVERAAATRLRELGAKSARRTQQYAGYAGTSDIIAEDELPNWHIEVKGVKTKSIKQSRLQSFHKQVVRDIGKGQKPVILIQCVGEDFTAMLPLIDWEKIRGRNTFRFGRYFHGKSLNPNEYFSEFNAVSLVQEIGGLELPGERIPELYFNVYDKELSITNMYVFLRIEDWASLVLK